MRCALPWRLITLAILACAIPVFAGGFRVAVEAEDEVYRYESANNGAGPSWCFGSTCIARVGSDVFASGLETIQQAKPLNNTRWMLFKREGDGWSPVRKDETGRTREPCPIGAFADGRVLMSVNPTLTPVDTYSGPAQPQILVFSAKAISEPPQKLLPAWDGNPPFSEHSYRSFALDGTRREMILFQNIGYTHTEWSFCDAGGQWIAKGKLKWPWGAEYAKPQPIRVCYPSVQLKNRKVFFCGVSDIVEPNDAWRQYKRKLTGQEWDYDFRRLFFTWTDDITSGEFKPWIEVASREKTAGQIFPCDLIAMDNGSVHVLWYERAMDNRLRKDFFPGEKQSESLNWAIIRDGQVVFRSPIVATSEDKPGDTPGRGRFHLMPDGRLLVIYYVVHREAGGKAAAQNRLVELRGQTIGTPVVVPIRQALSTFFTASIRAGNAPSDTIDLLADTGRTVCYARIRVQAEP